MSKHTDTPSTGYYAVVDVAEPEKSPVDLLRLLRAECGPKHIGVVLLDECGPSGHPTFRLHTPGNRTRLRQWLDRNGYTDEEIVDARHRWAQELARQASAEEEQ